MPRARDDDARGLIGELLGREELERDVTTQTRIQATIHNAHATSAQTPAHVIVAYATPFHDVGSRRHRR